MVNKPIYRMPAEWENHQSTWVLWPARQHIWSNLDEARLAYASVINCISDFEPVKVLHLQDEQKWIRKYCTSQIEAIPAKLDDSWARDVSPSFIYQGSQLRLVHWSFNAWGEKFTPYDNDNQVSYLISEQVKIEGNIVEDTVDFIFEGGSLHHNGSGLALTTKRCLLNQNRNPQLSQIEIEQILLDKLGLQELIWLPEGLAEDSETDGHIDNIACFINEHTLLFQEPHPEDLANQQCFNHNVQVLNKHCNMFRPLDRINIPPPPCLYKNDTKLPCSYLNFAFINQGILFPQFGVKKYDQAAMAMVQELFPKRKIVPTLAALTITQGGGGLHCITHQQPVRP